MSSVGSAYAQVLSKNLDRRALETGTLWVPISNFLGLKTVRRIFNPAQSAGLKCPRV